MATAGRRLRAVAALLSSPADTWLALETLGWMAMLPTLKHTVRLPALVQFMWRPGDGRGRRLEREEQIASLVRRLTHRSGGNCLERSLILYRLLSRANADPHLVIGMGAAGERLGHAWITVDEQPLFERSGSLSAYTELVRFGSDGRQTTAPQPQRLGADPRQPLP